MEIDARKALILEQYKSLVGDVGNIGTRYATANGFYLSVLTALLGVLAYVGAGKPIEETNYPIVILVAVFARIICWIWGQTIAFYGRLFGAKFAMLKLLEAELPLQIYEGESKLVYFDKAGSRLPALTEHEARVPQYLGWFFVAIAAASLILLYMYW